MSDGLLSVVQREVLNTSSVVVILEKLTQYFRQERERRGGDNALAPCMEDSAAAGYVRCALELQRRLLDRMTSPVGIPAAARSIARLQPSPSAPAVVAESATAAPVTAAVQTTGMLPIREMYEARIRCMSCRKSRVEQTQWPTGEYAWTCRPCGAVTVHKISSVKRSMR